MEKKSSKKMQELVVKQNVKKFKFLPRVQVTANCKKSELNRSRKLPKKRKKNRIKNPLRALFPMKSRAYKS